ncbi:MAG: LamG domain-containing protein [Chloroflexi bacterium]|nr:MAG: LamG domain-containing protein [Chloroflexota bacterium]
MDDYAISSSNLGISGDAELTMCCWVYLPATPGGWDSAMGNDSTGVTGSGLSLTLNQARPAIDFWINRFRATSAISTGAWHHIAVTKIPGTIDATHCKIYVDGIEVAGATEGSSTAPNIIDAPAVVGRLDGSRYLNAQICDVRFYNRTLTADEVQYIYSIGAAGIDPGNANLVAHYPLAEGASSTLYDVSGNNLHATLYNISEASFWANTQDVFHYNIDKGFSLYQHTTNNDLRVPYDLNGQPLSITPPSGYTLASEHPAGDWHNNAETKLQMPAGDANLAAGTFWMDSAGTLQARSYNDIVGIWNNENVTFADVSVTNKKKRIATYDSAQSGSALTQIKQYLNIP